MNIVQLMASPFVGGPERQVLGLAHALAPTHATSFLSFAERGLARALLDRATADGFEAVELRENFPRVSRAVAEVADELKRRKAQVVCTNGYKPDLIGWRAARRAGIPVIAVAHGWTSATWKVRLYEWMDARIMRWVDAVVCVSEAMADRVRRAGVPEAKVVVIRNAIDATPYDRACPDARTNVESLFDAPPRQIVGAVGRLSPEKGFDVFIDAAEIVLNDFPDTGFVLFGDGPERPALEARIKKAGLTGKFVLAGFRSDLENYLGGLDLAVSSSYTEGLPVAVLEAQAAGLCVVATKVGGTPEVITNMQTGLLAPPGDAGSLAMYMRLVLPNDERRLDMGRRAAQRVRDEFTFAAQAQHYQRLFDRLVPGGVPCR